MQILLRIFADIALFRKGPEDLPASDFLLFSGLGLYLLGTALTSSVVGADAGRLIAEVLADVGLLFLWFGGLLFVNRRLPRFRQTMSALLGANALLYFAAYPLMLWYVSSPVTDRLAQSLLILILIAWSVAVSAHIIRRALQVTFVSGMLISFLHYLISVQVFAFLFVSDNPG